MIFASQSRYSDFYGPAPHKYPKFSYCDNWSNLKKLPFCGGEVFWFALSIILLFLIPVAAIVLILLPTADRRLPRIGRRAWSWSYDTFLLEDTLLGTSTFSILVLLLLRGLARMTLNEAECSLNATCLLWQVWNPLCATCLLFVCVAFAPLANWTHQKWKFLNTFARAS